MEEILQNFDGEKIVKKYDSEEAFNQLEPIIAEIIARVDNGEIATKQALLQEYDQKIGEIYNGCANIDDIKFQSLIKKFEEIRDLLPEN
jgi:hypothetical protein